MSSGHSHGTSPNIGEHEYNRLMSDPRVVAELQRRPVINRSYDLPYVAGYSRDGKVVYIDRHFPTSHVIAGRRVNVLPFLITHEHVEKTMIDVFGFKYPLAHAVATKAEETEVRNKAGITPSVYEKIYKPYIKADEHEKLKRIPPDLDLKPYIDTHDTKLLAHIRSVMNRSDWQRAVKGH